MSANDQRDPIAFVQRWRVVIDTQMHLNDMLLRTRATAMSIVLAVFGGAALSVERFPKHLDLFLGMTVNVAAVVMFFGLLLLFTIFVVDYFYYYRMLLAAVHLGNELETASRQPGQPIELSLTEPISRVISRGRARFVLCVFYGVPFVSGLAFMLYLASLPELAR